MPGWANRILGWIAAIVAMLLACAPATAVAGTGLIGRAVPVCIAPVRPGENLDALVRGGIPLDCTTRQTRFGTGDFWISSGPLALPSGGDLRLRVPSVWHRSMTIGIAYADGRIDWRHVDNHDFSRRLQLGAIAEFPIAARDAAIARIVWRVDGATNRRGVMHGVSIATAAQSASANLSFAALYAGFAGLALALLIYNLAMWGALRHPFQLAYCAMVAFLLCYTFTTSAALAWAIEGIENTIRMRINYLTLGLAGAAALGFARRYFEPRVFERGLGRLVDGLIVGLGAVSLAIMLAPERWLPALDRAYTLGFGMLIAVVPLIVWRAKVARSRYTWIFALAWTAPLTLCGARVAHALNLTPWNFWVDNSTLIAMAIEAVLSSLAIAYRIRLLSAERDDALTQGALDRLLAQTDPLTGLLNRRAFLECAIGRDGRQLLILLDVDHFKRVNDLLGHDGGDEVLRVVARVLRQTAPDGALVARLGGEEFAIVADADAAIEPGEFLSTLRAARMPFDLSVTASIGGCAGPLMDEADWKRLYRAADRALFDAKASGRDRARMVDALAIAA